MKLRVFSVLDKAVSAYLQPFFAPTVGAAIRSFGDVVNDPSHQFAKHVDDYVLYDLGEFDDSTGFLIPRQEPERVIDGRNMLRSAETSV